MILGVDHLALSALNGEQASTVLAAAGFPAAFSERDLPNAPDKRHLLGSYRPSHDIALHRPPGGGIAIEITCHGAAFDPARGPYMPLIAGDLPEKEPREPASEEPDWPTILRDTLDVAAAPAAWPALDAGLWTAPPAEDAAGTVLRTVLLTVADLESEIGFWTGPLGWKLLRQNVGRWAHLRLASPVPAWVCELVLAAAPVAPNAALDSPGFTCLALIGSAIADEGARLKESGASEMTPPFQARVNGRDLEVLICRTPGGALIELIQLSHW